MREDVEMIRVGRGARCACGDDLRPGERAGQLVGGVELLCLWCLADLHAGRPRPRRRPVQAPAPWPAPALAPRATRRATRRAASSRRRPGGAGVPLVVALLVLAAALYVRPAVFGTPSGSVVVGGMPIPGRDSTSWGDGAALIDGGNPLDTSGIWPPTPPDARTEPLGTPGPRLSSSTDYSFMKTITKDGGRPVAWDPCRPIHLVINNAEAPPRAEELIREAVGSVSSATGLQFVIEGATTETPTSGRAPVMTSRYGDRWAPVLVAWTSPSVVPGLQGDVAGFAGPVSAPYRTTSQQHWVSGTVNLDGPQFSALLRTPEGWAAARAIVMHEFGHLIGLNHVTAKDQLMHESNTGQRAFGPGDREGLRQLGLGPCFTR